MLVAQASNGERIEATRELTTDAFVCPACAAAVVLKRGRVKVPHFAHKPGGDCIAAGEGTAHLHAKRVLADRFRAIGYGVQLEERHPEHDRRIDLAVSILVDGRRYRVAVEVQDSPISVIEMKRRMAADRRCGFFGTAWLFIGRRAEILLQPADEVRVPNEILWLDRRFDCGVFVFDGEAVYHVEFGDIVRTGGESTWFEEGGVECGETFPDRTLRATKNVTIEEAGFRLTCQRGRYHTDHSPDWFVGFAISSSPAESVSCPPS